MDAVPNKSEFSVSKDMGFLPTFRKKHDVLIASKGRSGEFRGLWHSYLESIRHFTWHYCRGQHEAIETAVPRPCML